MACCNARRDGCFYIRAYGLDFTLSDYGVIYENINIKLTFNWMHNNFSKQ